MGVAVLAAVSGFGVRHVLSAYEQHCVDQKAYLEAVAGDDAGTIAAAISRLKADIALQDRGIRADARQGVDAASRGDPSVVFFFYSLNCADFDVRFLSGADQRLCEDEAAYLEARYGREAAGTISAAIDRLRADILQPSMGKRAGFGRAVDAASRGDPSMIIGDYKIRCANLFSPGSPAPTG